MTTARSMIVGGNWKMNTTRASAEALTKAVVDQAAEMAMTVDVVLFPPFPYLHHVGVILADTPIQLGAQDLYPEPKGAFTGEVGLEMLSDLGVSHVLIGHSERRHVIGEPSELICRKLRAAIDADLTAVLCIGETLEEREQNRTERVNLDQLSSALEGVNESDVKRLVIAYEPVWAIGTGRTATPDDAQTVHRVIRQWLKDRYTENVGESIRIQYGGSVKPDNAEALLQQPDVDGGLIGGASLKDGDFLDIVRAASTAS